MGSQKGIEDLPNELLVKIFSYLSFRDLVYSVQYVNDRWLEVSRVSGLWKNLSYKLIYNESDSYISELLREAPMLESLVLSERCVRSNVLNTFMDKCPKLKRLEFNDHQRLSTPLLKKMVQKCPNIEILSIPMNVLNKKCQAEIIGMLMNLKILYVGGWDYPDDVNPVFLKPLADGCPALESVDLKGNMYTNEDLAYFLAKKKHQLHSLRVIWSSADDICCVPLLAHYENLKTLSLVYDVDIQDGFDSLQKLKSVTSLTLYLFGDPNINDVMGIFDRRAMSQLVELSIKYYECYEDKLADVIVKNCPLLKILCFKKCMNLTDQSVVNFYRLNELQKVNLSGSSISDESIVHLSKCRNLQYLKLRGCRKLTDKSMDHLTLFSELQVVHLDCYGIVGLPSSLMPSSLEDKKYFDVQYCFNMCQDALRNSRQQVAQLRISDRLVTAWKNELALIEDLDIDFANDTFIFKQLQIS